MLSAYIFDWSGTLSDDFDMVYRATARVIAELDNSYSLSEDEYRKHFELPYMKFYKNYGLNVSKEKVDALFFRFVKENAIQPKPFPSSRAVLEGLRQQGKKTYLFSAHPKKLVDLEVSAYGFQRLFDGIEPSVIDKVASLKGFVRKNDLNPTETAYVGDLVHDIDAAKTAGLVSIGMFSRYQSRDKLHAAKPDYIITSLEELLKI